MEANKILAVDCNKEYDFLKNIQVFTRLYGVKNYDSLRNTLKAVQNKHFN